MLDDDLDDALAAPPTTSTGSRAMWSARNISRASSKRRSGSPPLPLAYVGDHQRMGIRGRDRRLRARASSRPTTRRTKKTSPTSSPSRPTNPSSIRNCFEVARTNARAVRTALTMEMWDAINGTWLELKRYGNGPTSREEFSRFLRWVQESSLRFDGSAYRTMLRNDAYWFSRLGVYHRARRQHRAHSRREISSAAAGERARRRPARLFPVGGDPALGLGAHRLSLGLSREPEALADRRPADPQRPDAALARELLREPRRASRQHRRAYGRQGPAQRQARTIRTRLQNAAWTRSSRAACTNSSANSFPTTTGSAR